jgi:hypothetical protein
MFGGNDWPDWLAGAYECRLVSSGPVDDGRVNHRPQEDVMESILLLDRAGRRRSPATTSSFHRGVPPHNKGSCRRRHEPFYAHFVGMPTLG